MRVVMIALLLASGCGRVWFDERVDAGSRDAGLILPAACPADPRLLACYAFEGDAADASGQGNDGTPVDVTYPTAIDGRALGSIATSRIDIATPSFGTTTYTLEAWMNTEAPNQRQLVFDHDARWAFGLDDNGFITCAHAGTGLSGQMLVAANTWMHVACAYDGTDLELFVDGVSVNSLGIPPANSSTGVAAISGNAPPNDELQPFIGTIDRLRVWNVALSRDELCTLGGC